MCSTSNARHELETIVYTSQVLLIMFMSLSIESEVVLIEDESSGCPSQVGRCDGMRIERCQRFVGACDRLT